MFICYFFSIFLPFICVFLTYTHYYIYLFVFGCVGSLLLHVGFLQLQNADFSLWWLLLLQNTGCRQAGFSSRYTGAHQLWLSGPRACRMQQLRFVGAGAQIRQVWRTGLFAPRHEGSSRTGDQTAVSPALAGEFLPAAPPGKSFFALFISCLCICVAHILIGLRP